MAYASKYYDPQKAHEYYMKHRQLKGRRSKSSLNEAGKEAIDYIKSQLQEERDARKAEIKLQKEKSIKALKSKLEKDRMQLKLQVNSTIEVMRNRLKNGNLTGAQKDALKDRITRIREKYSSAKKALTTKCTADRKAITEKAKQETKQANQDYKDKYNAEFDKLVADEGFKKKKR